MRRLDGPVTQLSGSSYWHPSADGRVGDIDRDGSALSLSDDKLTMIFDDHDAERPGVQGETRYMDGLACWTNRGTVMVYDARLKTWYSVDQVGPGAAKALAFNSPDGSVWVLYQTDAEGGVCHLITDATQGYRFGVPMHIYDPDVLVGPDGRAAIYWAVREGQTANDIAVMSTPVLGTGMVPLLSPVHVPPTPVPPTPVPPEPEPMKIPASVIATIHAFVGAYPIPQGDGSEAWIDSALRRIADGWMHRMAQTIAARHGVKWGRKRASLSRPISKESIALLETGLHGWDLLASAASGRPTLKTDSYHNLVAEDNQIFVPVEPFDHLADIAPPTDRPTITVPLWSASSFDLGNRLAYGDRRWIDQVLKPYRLVARLVVASYFRRPDGETVADIGVSSVLLLGLERLRLTLKTLAADGLRCVPTLLVDTAKLGLTRDDARHYVTACDRVMRDYPETIEGVRFSNERSHDVEADWLLDTGFMAELAALVDPRFPLAYGAGHGGEGVSMDGGSYLVHHPDRALDTKANAAIMHAAQLLAKRPVVDDEQIGIAEHGTPGQRVYSADYLLTSVREAQRLGYGGVTIHLHAGLSADVDALGPVQRQALEAFGAEIGRGGVIPPVPVPIVDPIQTLKNESIDRAIHTAYQVLLRRVPDDDGLAHYRGELQSGRLDVAGMEAAIKAGSEYALRNP